MDYLVSGKITKTNGLKGLVNVLVTSSFFDARFKKGKKLYVKDDENNEYSTLTIETINHKAGDLYLVKFKEINSIEEAEAYKGKLLFSIKDQSLLKKDEYYFDDLIGLKVFKENGDSAGKIIKIEEFTNVYSFVIKYENITYNIPYNDFFVKEIDLENKKVIIHYIEGLF